MRADQIVQQQIDEVSMSPKDFAADISSPGASGVKIGYEFEVCIPRDFYEKSKSKSKSDMLNDLAAWWNDNIVYQSLDSVGGRGVNIDVLDQYLTIKPSQLINKQLTTFRENMDALQKDIAAEAEIIWNQMPIPLRKKIREKIDARGATDIVADFLSTTKEDIEKRFSPPIIYVWAVYVVISRDRSLRNYIDRHNIYPNPQSEFRSLLRPIWDMGHFLESIFQYDIDSFKKLFTFDIEKTYNELPKAINPNWVNYPDDDFYGDEYEEYGKAKNDIAKEIKRAFGKPVVTFNDYHQQNKKLDRWYIEPDGSLEPEEGDAMAEIVSPPYPAVEALQVLRTFFDVAKSNKWYTGEQYKTGLHINVSIPEKLDILKLAVFLGDQHVLKHFNRLNNPYADSVMRSLMKQKDYTNWISRMKSIGFEDTLKTLQQTAKNISGEHTASISYNGTYVSFRHAGGNYLDDFTSIKNVVGRFVRAMIIASSPDAYRQEYLKKVVRLISPDNRDTLSQGLYDVLRILRSRGLPVLQVETLRNDSTTTHMYGRNILFYLWSKANNGSSNGSNWIRGTSPYLMIDRSPATMNALKPYAEQVNDSRFKDLYRKGSPTRFARGTFIPSEDELPNKAVQFIDRLQLPEGIMKIGDYGGGWAKITKRYLPLTHPATINSIKYILGMLRAYKNDSDEDESPRLPLPEEQP